MLHYFKNVRCAVHVCVREEWSFKYDITGKVLVLF